MLLPVFLFSRPGTLVIRVRIDFDAVTAKVSDRSTIGLGIAGFGSLTWRFEIKGSKAWLDFLTEHRWSKQ